MNGNLVVPIEVHRGILVCCVIYDSGLQAGVMAVTE